MRIISLFCGAGGMDLGFVKAGHTIIWANDNDPDSCLSYEKYFHHKPVCKDIEKVPSSEIPNGDVVIGGFPCQGFSIANKLRHGEDKRNKLYEQLLRVINDKSPKYFVAENVPGICSIGGYESHKDRKERKGRIFKRILKELANAGKSGYNVAFNILNAADFGVPQNRRRVIILGTRKDIFPVLKHPEPPKGIKKPVVADAIANMPEPIKWSKKKERIEGPLAINGVYNQYGTEHKVKINGYLGNRKTDWNRPSPTITGRGGGTGGPVIIPHPEMKRRMTVREYARLQSFPDDFIFYGSPTSQYRQVGNAVPWLLAYNVAKMIPLSLKNETQKVLETQVTH